MFRKRLTFLLAIVMCFSLCGCSVNISIGNPSPSALAPASTADSSLTAPAAGLQTDNSTGAPSISPVQGNGQLSADEAKRIALEDAGAAENDVTFTKCEQDIERGDLVWEIEFRFDRMEYEYEISATDGSIVKRDIDRD